MKVVTLLNLMFWVTVSAWAGPTIIIEHPRYPFVQKDIYTVKCDVECEVTISSMEPFQGSTKLALLPEKIRALISRSEKGEFPAFPGTPRMLYDIHAEDGERKFDLKVGLPKSYRGTEFTKFTVLIDLIEEIKFLMRKSEKKL